MTADQSFATVLTDNKIMVTKGLGVGMMMGLEDWLILAEDREVLVVSSPPPAAPVAPAAPAAPAPPPAPIGSKFRWTLNPETYRVAIMTDKGVLQVKSVTDGAGEVHPNTCRECTPCRHLAMTPPAPWARRPLIKTLFADEAAWRASLPAGGAVSIDVATTVSPKNQEMPQGLSDAEQVMALQKRFKIRSESIFFPSHNENIQHWTQVVANQRARLNALTLEDDTQQPGIRKRETRYLKRSIQILAKYRVRAATEGDPYKKRIGFFTRGTGKLYISIGGVNREIAACRDDPRLIGVAGRDFFNSFADMGADMTDGKPSLSVWYRRRVIKV